MNHYKNISLLIAAFALTSCASISPQEQARISVDLKGTCLRLYGNNQKDPVTGYWDYVGWTGHNRVFAIGNYNGQQACGFGHGGMATTSHDQAAMIALSQCNKSMPGGVGCQVYAIDSNIVYNPSSAPPINNYQPPTQQTTASSGTSSINSAKEKCKDLGFKSGTEDFGKCVLQLSK